MHKPQIAVSLSALCFVLLMAGGAVLASSVAADHQPIPESTASQAGQTDDANANTITGEEKKAGWHLLFDGKSLNGWHNFKKTDIRPGWKVQNGTLFCADPHDAGDLVTIGKYDWFELSIDYLISAGGNSGIMFHVTDDGATVPTRPAGSTRSILPKPTRPDLPVSGTACAFSSARRSASMS
jgi:hypothetical protein